MENGSAITGPGAPLRLAVVGCGAVARLIHAPAIAALAREGLVRVVAVCDPLPDQAAALRALLPEEPPSVPFDALESHVADAVLIASPAALHRDQCLRLLRSGLHVLCEKPLALDAASAEEIAAEAARVGKVCAVALQRRFWPSCQGVRTVLRAGWIGRPERIEVKGGGPFGWAAATDSFFKKQTAGGGTLLDLGIHVLDILGVWFGPGRTTKYEDDARGGIESTCALEAEWPSGVPGRIELTREFRACNLCRITGSGGEILWDLFDPHTFMVRARGATWLRADTRGQQSGAEEARPPQERLWRAFLDEIGGMRTPIALAGDVKSPHEMIDGAYAARRSLACPWTELPWGFAVQPAAPRTRRMAVLGATGFVGGRLCELALQGAGGFEVRPLARRATGLARLARLDVEWARADAYDRTSLRAAFSGCDVVVDAMMPGLEGIDTAAVNVALAAAECGVKKLIYISTQAVFGLSPAEGTTESTPLPWRSESPYAEGKRRAEKALGRLRRRLGIEIVILRPGIVYGPGSRWVTNMADSFAGGAGWLVDGGAGVINAIHVDNLCQAVFQAADAPALALDGKAFFVNDAEASTWRDFCAPIARVTGVDLARLPGPPPPPRLSLLGRALGLRSHPFARFLLPRLPAKVKRAVKAGLAEWSAAGMSAQPDASGAVKQPAVTVFDPELAALQKCRWRFPIGRAIKEFGYSPPVGFAEGMKLALEWWRTARHFAGPPGGGL